MIPPPPNHLFSAFSFIGFVMCAVPFYWHLEAWNTGTCLYMAWVGLGCLNYFINSIVWDKSLINYAPVWCDISTHFLIALNVAVPAASLCINRRLYKIATVKAVMFTRADKRRAIYTDLAIGLGIPLIQLPLQYVVAGHRFDLYEDFGPFYFTWNTAAAYPLQVAWPLAIGVVAAVYSIMTICTFWKRGRQFNKVLSSNRNLHQGRYWRLMVLAGLEVYATIPICVYTIYYDVSSGVHKWKSWADTHYNFSKVEQIPSVLWKNDYRVMTSVELSRWYCVLCAFLFFGFFGFADEALKHYRLAYTSLSSRLGYSTTTVSSDVTSSVGYGSSYPNMSSKGGVTLPVFISKNGRSRAESLLSISDKLSTSISVGDFTDDVGDSKTNPYSPTDSPASSSSPSSASSIHGVGTKLPEPTVPETAVTRSRPSLEISTVVRHDADAPSSPVRPASAYTVDVV